MLLPTAQNKLYIMEIHFYLNGHSMNKMLEQIVEDCQMMSIVFLKQFMPV